MSIEIQELYYKTSKRKIAEVTIKYYNLVLKCDLVFYPKDGKCWIRMPETWITKDQKVSYCYWDTRELSDEFQKVVLNKIFDAYDLDVDKIRDMHLKAALERVMKNPVDLIEPLN